MGGRGSGNFRCEHRAIRTHPLVQRLYIEYRESRRQMNDIAAHAGVSEHAIRHWFQGSSPSLALYEAVLNALGWKLIVVKKDHGG